MTLEEAVPLITITGAVITLGNFLVRKWLQRHRDVTITELSDRLDNARSLLTESERERDVARSERDASREQLETVTQDLTASLQLQIELQSQVDAQVGELAELRETKEALDRKQKTHDNRIRRALEMEGAIWTQPVMTGTPKFVPLSERRTPIISVLNLKGGVGKTTLTANLAWALPARGYRVLLVDLDLQGSLSSLFLRNEELARLGLEDQRLLQHYLTDANGRGAPKLTEFTVPVPQLNKHCRLVAASDRLAYAELSQTVRWLLRVGGAAKQWNGRHDGRMTLRRALHAKGLYKKFDVVLLDCPPLINLCCANALAASDYVLVPVTPSVKAIERVPPLLGRIKEMKDTGANPNLNPLGIVVNRTEQRSLTPREALLFHDLPAQCLKVYGTPVPRFDTIIQQRNAVRDGEGFFEVPDESHPLRITFEALAEELIKQRLPEHCRRPEDRVRNRATPTGENS